MINKGLKGWWTIFRWMLVTAFLLVLYFQLNNLKAKPDLLNRVSVFYKGESAIMAFISIISLTFINYLLESFKWHILVRPLRKMDIYNAYKDVISGLLFSILTPGRLGEPVGRVLKLRNELKLAGSASSLIGSFSQNLAITLMGAIGGFLYYYEKSRNFWIIVGFAGIVSGIIVFWLICFFNLRSVLNFFSNLKMAPKWKHYFTGFRYLTNYSFLSLNQVLLLSLFRICIWTTQYLFIIKLLVPDFNLVSGIPIAWLIFLIQTGIPLPPVTGLIARSSIAIFMWKELGVDEWNAMTSSFVIYFYNLIIPSLAGLIVVFWNTSKNNEDN